MVDPGDQDGEERDDVGSEGRELVTEEVPQTAVCAGLLDAEDEQGRCDGDHAVAERLHPTGRQGCRGKVTRSVAVRAIGRAAGRAAEGFDSVSMSGSTVWGRRVGHGRPVPDGTVPRSRAMAATASSW
jgi:hypothetical protein